MLAYWVCISSIEVIFKLNSFDFKNSMCIVNKPD